MDGLSSNLGDAQLVRQASTFVPHTERFLMRDRVYTLQYSHIYTKRLAFLRPLVLAAATRRWGDAMRVCAKIVDLQPEAPPPAAAHHAGSSKRHAGCGGAAAPAPSGWVVCGCVYKEMRLKPSVLDSYSGDRSMEAPKARASYASADDTLILEDESGRVMLTAAVGVGGAPPFLLARLCAALVTGVTVAVHGKVLDTGELAVDDLVLPGLSLLAPPSSGPNAAPPSPSFSFHPARASAAAAAHTPSYVLLLSNLNAGVPHLSSPLLLQLLAEWLSGMAGGAVEAAGVARIRRIVIAGGLVGRLPGATGSGAFSRAPARGVVTGEGGGAGAGAGAVLSDKQIIAAEQDAAATMLRDADAFLAQLCAVAPVDVMPGEGDPANVTLPQLPFHPLLFSASSRFNSLKLTTNPYDASVDGVRLLGCSGQNVADIIRYTASSHVMANEAGVVLVEEGAVAVAAEAGVGAGAGADADVAMAEPGDAAAAAAGSAALAATAALAALAAMGEGGSGEGGDGDGIASPPAALADATSSTAGDKAMQLIAGTGAGTGFGTRATRAGGEGAEAEAAAALSLSPLDVLTNTLLWRHQIPTAPDTLACYPFATADPFVIASERLPGVYFAGASRAYASRLVHATDGSDAAVRVVCVPDFSLTGVGVLVDIASPTLATQTVVFRAAQ